MTGCVSTPMRPEPPNPLSPHRSSTGCSQLLRPNSVRVARLDAANLGLPRLFFPRANAKLPGAKPTPFLIPNQPKTRPVIPCRNRTPNRWFFRILRGFTLSLGNLAGTRMSKPQVSDETTINPMQDIPSLFIASTPNAKIPYCSACPPASIMQRCMNDHASTLISSRKRNSISR